MQENTPTVSKVAYYLGFAQAVVATSGSLFFSEVMHLPPCVLCWYQRICMYPLVLIFAIGIIKRDKWLPWYVLPLTAIGTGIGIYHNLLYYHILPESVAPCINGVSCTSRLIEIFGFITIPMLSLSAFCVILICTIVAIRYNKSVPASQPNLNQAPYSNKKGNKKNL